MKYINPYEIATFIQFNNLNTTTFKTFKKKLSAELELGDNEIIINDVKLHKNEIYELIDAIERDKNLLNIFKSLYENKELNNFLNGNANSNIKKLKNILLLEDKQTIDFITDYLIQILSRIYKEAFSKYQVDILQLEPPLNEKYYEKIYEPIYKILKNKENELIELKNNYYEFYDIKNITNDIKNINALPDYFIKIRSDIAQAIRNLSIDSWNDNNDLELALNLINYALAFNVKTKVKDNFLSDKNDLEEIKENKILINFLDKINDVLNNSSLVFSTKLYKIIDILKQKDSKLNDNTSVLIVYNMINKYIEENESIIKNNILSLKNFFKYLLEISNDSNLNKSLNKDIDTLTTLKKDLRIEKTQNIQKQNYELPIKESVTIEEENSIEDKVNNFFGYIILLSIIIGAFYGMSNGKGDGFFGGALAGLVIGGIPAIALNAIIKFIIRIFS